MKDVTIKKASLQDIHVLQLLARETFFETFAHSNTEENMKKYLEENFTEHKIKQEMTTPDSIFYIAWEDDDAVGYLKLNFGNAQTELKDEDSLEIERIYVKSSHHGRKVGQLLYDKALQIAQLENKLSIWLGVWEENPRAIRFYEKNGFIAFNKHIFKMGNDEQIDIMMKKTL